MLGRTVMKIRIGFIWLVSLINHAAAQQKEPTHMFRVYDDNDCLNLAGNLTDNSYTNGTSLEYFYVKLKPPRFPVDRWMPKAGKEALAVFNWKFTQLMVTPENTDRTRFQPNDYPYAGALFATHGLTSYNVSKKYSLNTEIIFGIRGPASFAEQTQKLIHRILDFPEPKGWKYQLKTSPLINVNFGVEKLLVAGHYFELISGAKLSAGSFKDAFSIYPLVRIGKMLPFFDGLLKQFGSYERQNRKPATQFYLVISPVVNWILHDALMYGETENSDKGQPGQETVTRGRKIRHRVTEIKYGAVLAHGRYSISYLQTFSTEYNTGLYHHSYGNISATVSW